MVSIADLRTSNPVNTLAGDELIELLDDPGGVATSGGTTVDAIRGQYVTPDATVDLVEGALFVNMPDGVVNGIIVKVAAASTGYGRGQAFMILEEGVGDATDQTSAGSILFRIDEVGSVGVTGGLHVATGLRKAFAGTQAVWIDPSVNTIPLVIHNPSDTEAATWDKDFLQVVNIRNANEQVFRVASNGGVLTTREFTARNGAATQVTVGSVFGFAGLGLGSATDTLLYRADAAILQAHNVIRMPERADPSAPPANTGQYYMRDNGSGKTQFCIRFPTGAIQVLATEP